MIKKVKCIKTLIFIKLLFQLFEYVAEEEEVDDLECAGCVLRIVLFLLGKWVMGLLVLGEDCVDVVVNLQGGGGRVSG
ncbi:hypothetical protein ABES25_23380 [Bacillus gobiensis]|uniref:hypothetical protein n=1 Tax=Bacillus gobiensis TaxID=1441095 RepID=UPI003D23E2E6